MSKDRKKRSSAKGSERSSIIVLLAAKVFSRRLSMVVPVLYMGLILVGASIPADNGEAGSHRLHFLLLPSLLQNLIHIPAYGLLAFLWRWCLDAYVQARTAVVLALFLTIGFGIFQEWYQITVPGRYASISDIVFDAIGAVLGVWLFKRLKNKFCNI